MLALFTLPRVLDVLALFALVHILAHEGASSLYTSTLLILLARTSFLLPSSPAFSCLTNLFVTTISSLASSSPPLTPLQRSFVERWDKIHRALSTDEIETEIQAPRYVFQFAAYVRVRMLQCALLWTRRDMEIDDEDLSNAVERMKARYGPTIGDALVQAGEAKAGWECVALIQDAVCALVLLCDKCPVVDEEVQAPVHDTHQVEDDGSVPLFEQVHSACDLPSPPSPASCSHASTSTIEPPSDADAAHSDVDSNSEPATSSPTAPSEVPSTISTTTTGADDVNADDSDDASSIDTPPSSPPQSTAPSPTNKQDVPTDDIFTPTNDSSSSPSIKPFHACNDQFCRCTGADVVFLWDEDDDDVEDGSGLARLADADCAQPSDGAALFDALIDELVGLDFDDDDSNSDTTSDTASASDSISYANTISYCDTDEEDYHDEDVNEGHDAAGTDEEEEAQPAEEVSESDDEGQSAEGEPESDEDADADADEGFGCDADADELADSSVDESACSDVDAEGEDEWVDEDEDEEEDDQASVVEETEVPEAKEQDEVERPQQQSTRRKIDVDGFNAWMWGSIAASRAAREEAEKSAQAIAESSSMPLAQPVVDEVVQPTVQVQVQQLALPVPPTPPTQPPRDNISQWAACDDEIHDAVDQGADVVIDLDDMYAGLGLDENGDYTFEDDEQARDQLSQGMNVETLIPTQPLLPSIPIIPDAGFGGMPQLPVAQSVPMNVAPPTYGSRRLPGLSGPEGMYFSEMASWDGHTNATLTVMYGHPHASQNLHAYARAKGYGWLLDLPKGQRRKQLAKLRERGHRALGKPTLAQIDALPIPRFPRLSREDLDVIAEVAKERSATLPAIRKALGFAKTEDNLFAFAAMNQIELPSVFSSLDTVPEQTENPHYLSEVARLLACWEECESPATFDILWHSQSVQPEDRHHIIAGYLVPTGRPPF